MTRIEKIKALCESATKGPWFTTLGLHGKDQKLVYSETLKRPFGEPLLEAYHTETDANFIAQSRTIVPELLELVQEMAGALEQWVSHTGSQYDPVKERVTEKVLAKYKAWKEGE